MSFSYRVGACPCYIGADEGDRLQPRGADPERGACPRGSAHAAKGRAAPAGAGQRDRGAGAAL